MADEVADTQVNTEAEVATEAPEQAAEQAATEEAPSAPEVSAEAEQPVERKSLSEQAAEPDEAAVEGKEGEDVAEEAADYTDFTLPEGMGLDDVALAEFAPVAKELGLKQEGAQKLVDVIANKHQRDVAAAKVAQSEAIDKWEQEIKSNPEWKTNVLLADKAIAAIGNKDFTALANDPSVGSYPPFKEAMAWVGKLLSESNFAEGNGSEPTQSRMADRFYPGNTKK